MAKKTDEPVTTPQPAPPLAMFPIGTATEQEAAWNILRRYRRQVAKLSPTFRCFVVESLHSDLQNETTKAAERALQTNGAGDAAF